MKRSNPTIIFLKRKAIDKWSTLLRNTRWTVLCFITMLTQFHIPLLLDAHQGTKYIGVSAAENSPYQMLNVSLFEYCLLKTKAPSC